MNLLDRFFKQKLSPRNVRLNAQSSQTFCPLPFLSFYGSASGEIVPCCESQDAIFSRKGESFKQTWNNDKYRELRRQLMAGEKPEVCEKCWKNEKAGLKSNRMQALQDLEENFYGMDQVECLDNGKVQQTPTFVELKASNICNLKCRMCHVDSSHRVLEDIEIIRKYRFGFPEREKPLRADDLISQLKEEAHSLESTLRVLQYSGGEPLISREQFELTSLVGESFGDRVQLRYSTNLNNLIFEKYDVIELWKKFKHVHVKVSADGINDVYDYIRVGGSFETLVQNMDRLMNVSLSQIDVAIGFTSQIYNVFQLPEFIDFFTQYVDRPRISTHLLYTPNFMCLEALPDNIKERVINKLTQSSWDFSGIIDFLRSHTENEATLRNWDKFLRYTDEMEAKHGIQNRGFQYLLDKYLDGY